MKALLLIGWSVILIALPTMASAGNTRIQETVTPPAAAVEWIDIGAGLEFHYYFTSNEFAMYILGEVRNNTTETVSSPSISLTLLDGDGNIVGAQGLIDVYPIVEPGTPTPYQVVLDPSIVPGSWKTETVEAYSTEGYGPTTCSTGLELRDVVEEDKLIDWLDITGKAYNGGTVPLDGVIVWAAVYRTDGVFAGIVNGSIGAAIPSDKWGAFRVYGSLMPGLTPDYTYRLFATNTTGGSTYC